MTGFAPIERIGQPEQQSARGPSQATVLVQLAADAELFHDDDQAFATMNNKGHLETWPVRSKTFRRWLARLYFESEGRAPAAHGLQDAMTVLEGKAIFEGPSRMVHVRLAEVNGTIWLDLCDEDWQAVEITAEGWRVVAAPPVRFRRAKAMLPLPMPVTGGSLDDLRAFVNVKDDSDFALLVAWIIGALRSGKPCPVLIINGEQGSAKSTLCRLLRLLVDPNAAPIRAEPREVRDLMIAANNGLVIALDNVSHLPSWLSDAICRLSTGGGFSTRTLYENDEETIFDALRPVILNGIEEIATRSDLLDRTLRLSLQAIAEDQRRAEDELLSEFEKARPRILGALLDAVSTALCNIASVKLDRLPRMADFAKWVVAAEPVCPWKPGLFLDAYQRNRASAHELAIEASLIGPVLLAFAQEVSHWHGTASELLDQLDQRADHRTSQQRGWPKRANGLSNALRRIVPNLRAVGVDTTFHRRTKLGRFITIRTTAQKIVTTVTDRHQPDSEPESGGVGDNGLTIGDDLVTTPDRPETSAVTQGDDGDDDLHPDSGEVETWTL